MSDATTMDPQTIATNATTARRKANAQYRNYQRAQRVFSRAYHRGVEGAELAKFRNAKEVAHHQWAELDGDATQFESDLRDPRANVSLRTGLTNR